MSCLSAFSDLTLGHTPFDPSCFGFSDIVPGFDPSCLGFSGIVPGFDPFCFGFSGIVPGFDPSCFGFSDIVPGFDPSCFGFSGIMLGFDPSCLGSPSPLLSSTGISFAFQRSCGSLIFSRLRSIPLAFSNSVPGSFSPSVIMAHSLSLFMVVWGQNCWSFEFFTRVHFTLASLALRTCESLPNSYMAWAHKLQISLGLYCGPFWALVSLKLKGDSLHGELVRRVIGSVVSRLKGCFPS
ncbi:hypothetical protein AAG906_027247 [Vitis piasezkii]